MQIKLKGKTPKGIRAIRAYGTDWLVRFGPAPCLTLGGAEGMLIEPFGYPAEGRWIPKDGGCDFEIR